MSKLSPQTKSFIILFAIAVFGVCLSLLLWAELSGNRYYQAYDYGYSRAVRDAQTSFIFPKIEPVDTSGWDTYTNEDYNLSFKLKPGWKVLAPSQKNGFTLLQIDPGKQYYNIKIYVKADEFYIMDGLPAQSETVGGAPAINVNYALYGVQANNMRYTFDVGVSMSLLSDFNALVHSAKFGS